MYNQGLSIEKCIEMYLEFAKASFQNEKIPWIPFATWLFQLARSYLRDGLYSPDNVETILKTVLGPEKTFLDCSYASEIGAKLCVLVATTLKNPCFRLFTNYNGIGRRDEKHGDSTMKPEEGAGRVPLWEIARAASAAPFYFPPRHIHDVGVFQDAGLLENDPTATAISEATAIYPSINQPDMILSLGTGHPKSEIATLGERPIYGKTWKQRALGRVIDLLWEKTREKQARRALATNPRYHRLDHEMDKDYSLDDVSHMSELKSRVESDTNISPQIDVIARELIAKLFYLELIDLPKRFQGKYRGQAQILCSILSVDTDFEVMIQRLGSQAACFYVNGEPVPVLWRGTDILDAGRNFRKRKDSTLFLERRLIKEKDGEGKIMIER
ncbi:hypothetical protein LTS07_011160 [Exophiala sideris]|uniref:PNPLA domain-containing protein n=1 Tax=Exophiala sideris TaxID=1016849 RepID=A0ABR0IVP3_9EURO|nr:hypothetical protein LTS07_011160 [Exophiala sideris]KAK5030190.1 hypothetical protein LTR13_008208 [Exophiala sideris]KAK5049152.1 hypothetical protein LTR69_011179 [Exophiala sideris]KAK5176420.1 hypothetical protein LTR44_011042 [Eurotiomycetes sp. CCFEE 6388]